MSDADHDRLGFKCLTPQNMLEPDPVTLGFAIRRDGEDEFREATGDDWARHILAPQLDEGLPEELYGLFEAARGMLVYGFYFYPVFTLGMGRLYQVADAATVHRCRQLGASKKKSETFAGRIKWLGERGMFSDEQRCRWDATRSLRNTTSHEERQSIFLGTSAITAVSVTAKLANALFATEPDEAPPPPG